MADRAAHQRTRLVAACFLAGIFGLFVYGWVWLLNDNNAPWWIDVPGTVLFIAAAFGLHRLERWLDA